MLAAALVAASLAATSPGEPGPVEVQWHGPSECAEAPRTRQMLAQLLERSTVSSSTEVTVHVTAEGDDFVASIAVAMEGDTLHRTLRGRPCRTLADAVALVVAVTIDPVGASAVVGGAAPGPTGADAEPDEPVAPGPPRATIPMPPPHEVLPEREPDPMPRLPRATVRGGPARIDAPERRDRSPPDRRIGARIEGGGTFGLVPGVGGSLGVGIGVDVGAARFTAVALHGFARPIRHSRLTDAGADVARWAARASGCWSGRAGRFTFPLCAGIEAGAFTARGFGLTASRTVAAPWVAVVPHAQPTLWATRWLGIGLLLQAPIALTRPRFSIDDAAADLVRVGPAGVRFGLALELVFFDETGSVRRTGRGSG